MTELTVSCPIDFDDDCRASDRSYANSLWTSLKTNGTKLALSEIETGRRATYADLLSEASRVARRLLSVGCQSTDVVAIFSSNSITWIVVYLAICRIAAIPATINPLLTPGELLHQLKTCEAKFVFTTKTLIGTTLEATGQLKTIKNILLNGASHPECIDLNADATCPVNGSRIDLPPLPSLESLPGQGPDDPATIFFSSGTTGVQKAILLSNRNMQHSFIGYCHPKFAVVSRSRILSYATYSHATGFAPGLHGLILGIENFIMSRFDFETFLRAVDENKIDSILMVPPIAVMMSKSPLCDKYNLTSLKDIIAGSAPLSAEIEELLMKRFPGLVVRQGYGLTETSGVTTVTPLDGSGRHPKRKPGSVGVPVPHMIAKVIDIKTGESLGPGQSGEICTKSPLNMLEYLNNPLATQQTIPAGGWLHTGDIGYYDEDGYFYIVDRLKELIKYKGYQVPPVELEHVLLSHPEVADAGVIGLPDAEAGELPLAWVVRKPNSTVTEAEIQQFVNGKVAPFKRLRGGVQFVSAIPRTASGKIVRREMKAALLKAKL